MDLILDLMFGGNALDLVRPLEASVLGCLYRERTHQHSTRDSIIAMQTDPAKVLTALADYPALQILFGPVITARLAAPNPACYLLQALEGRLHTLAWWQQRCAAYLANVTSIDAAVTKLAEDLVGRARKDSPDDFNSRLGDAMAEISAVCELSLKGCSAFAPIIPLRVGKKTQSAVDYSCAVTPDASELGTVLLERAYVEVKNLRAPVGITDAFARAFSRIAESGELNGFGIVLKHYHDNTVTVEQRLAIEEFVASLPGRTLPFHITLGLPGGVDVEATVVHGGKGVCLVRGIGGHHPVGPFTDRVAFLGKATTVIQKGVAQLSSYNDGMRLLVLNVQSPDAMFTHEIGIELQEIVAKTSNGSVDLVLLHHHSFIED